MTTTRSITSKIIAGFLILGTFFVSTAQAAKAVSWADLPKKIGKGKMRSDNREDRQYRVVTKAGKTYVGYELIFSPSDVSLGDARPSIPREQVTEIRIRRDRRLSDALLAPGGAIIDYCFPVLSPEMLLAIPVAWAATAVATPIILPIEGIKKLLPDKVVKVAP